MAMALNELWRVLASDGRAVFVIGNESRVLGVPFYNADIIEQIALELGLFGIVLRQKRIFTNRFGKAIREDLLNFTKLPLGIPPEKVIYVARSIATKALQKGQTSVSDKNRELLIDAIERIQGIQGTQVFLSNDYRNYQTRDRVMMVKEEENS